MPLIELTELEKEALARKLQAFLIEELDLEIGRFDAESLLMFVADELGPAVYNLALDDARRILARRADSMIESLVELEKSPFCDP